MLKKKYVIEITYWSDWQEERAGDMIDMVLRVMKQQFESKHKKNKLEREVEETLEKSE